MKNKIEKVIRKCWDIDQKVGIIFIVSIYNKEIPFTHFPFGSEYNITQEVKACKIDVSLSACKSFGYNAKTDTFDYDIGVNGKPFYGSTPIDSILAVVDLESGAIIEQFEPKIITQKDPSYVNIEVEIDYSDSPKLVWTNPETVNVNKSTANLSIVKC